MVCGSWFVERNKAQDKQGREMNDTKKQILSYKDLKIWNMGIDIVNKTYILTDQFPSVERYSLSAQMRRAAVSIPSNIAEGFMRYHKKEYIQFLYIALGSTAELETQLYISKKRKYVKENIFSNLQEDLDYEKRMMINLIKGLRKYKNER